jgi:hypothetical protein
MGIETARLAELEAKHVRTRYVEGDDWAVVLALPNIAALKRYKHELHEPTLRPDAQENLFRKMAVCCWTSKDGECDVDKLLAFAPLAPEGSGDAVSSLTGLKAQERVKS